MTYAEFVEMVKRHEGAGPIKNGHHQLYRDSVGKQTIGYGRNLDDCGITPEEAEYLLQNDLGRARSYARQAFPWFDFLDQVRQYVVTELVFWMGIGGVEGFTHMLGYLQANDYGQAASALLDSELATKYPKRANELAELLRDGF